MVNVSVAQGLLSLASSHDEDIHTMVMGVLWVFAFIIMNTYVRGHHVTLAFRLLSFQFGLQFTLWEKGV